MAAEMAVTTQLYDCARPHLMEIFDNSAEYVAFELCDMYAINGQALEEVLADISFVCNQLAIYEFDKSLVFQWLPVIHIPRGYQEVQQFAFLVTNQMQLESKELSHGTLASLGYTFEYFMNADPLVPAYSQWCAVYETYTCAFSKQYFFDEQSQRDSNLFFKFHETVVRDNLGKEMTQLLADFFQVEMFQTTVA